MPFCQYILKKIEIEMLASQDEDLQDEDWCHNSARIHAENDCHDNHISIRLL